jgi:phosphoesterase RecJ-like protein
MNEDNVIEFIRKQYCGRLDLHSTFIQSNYSNVFYAARKFFGSWGEAIEAAGINYNKVKKKGWIKPFIGEDGVLYVSITENLVANELYKLKKSKKIVEYIPRIEMTFGEKWICDFSIELLNGAELFLDISDLGGNEKKLNQFQEKLDFYNQVKVLYSNVSSPSDIVNIVEKFTNWYTIPIKDSLITSHENPDGDALASSISLYKYLESKGKRVALRFSGKIPRNLEWMIGECNIARKVPNWVENIIVLDCAPDSDRIGWDIPSNISIYNIDHHTSRINDNDPDNNIHVIDACSTASILFNYFGIKEDILVVGVYTDTFFTKKIMEVFNFLSKINIDEEKINHYISAINANPDKKLWKLLNESNVHRCRNGFIIVETSEEMPDVIESFMQILLKMSESVCLIYGNENNVKLRTSNNILDVSILAKEYSGGGHSYASMCNVNGKVSEFKSKIISLNVPKSSIIIDGYEEGNKNSVGKKYKKNDKSSSGS